jgi:hypothetical protein
MYYYTKKYWRLLTLQPSQPLLRILNLSNARVSVLPEVEEFLLMFYDFLA